MKVLLRGAAAALVVLAVVPAAASAAGQYIVELKIDPLASYAGGRRGIPATSPAVTGRKINRDSAAARQYRALIARRQDAALARLGASAPRPFYSYRTALAGFAADLTQAQVRELRAAPEVARVQRDRMLHPMSVPPEEADQALGGPTGDGASYLGLPTGLWQRLGGTDHAGEGVIVGVIDTGITPEHPSFADDGTGYIGPSYSPPAVWDGACQAGDRFNTSDCNNKLIGARYFVRGFGTENLAPAAFVSPRDDDGHGTHTASTAAGNYGVDPVIAGNDLGVGLISGIAPRAYVSAYKVCWPGGAQPSGCTTSDSVMAIDTAVADGVDVINYSVGSDTSEVFGPAEDAYLGAADAGVFVANSAGNAGPGAGTVGSPTSVPWITSVAAASLARTFEATATITAQDGTAFTVSGASVTQALPAAPLVDAANSAAPGVSAANAELCLAGSLDPAKVAGAVVLCKRGNNARIDKSKTVADAGGAGMILYNAAPNQEIVTDTHWVPAVHVTYEDGLRVKAVADQGGGTAALTAGVAKPLPRGGILAAFSSRGPQTAVPDIAKPDLTAPGVNILAGASPYPAPTSEETARPGQLFQSISGTSMAAPHVAGAGALLSQLHPTWSPAAIKSALMTTADPDVLEQDGTTPATPFDAGSGEIDPNRAADPGLVVAATTADYLGYLRAVEPDLFGPADPIEPILPSDLNLPSISFSALAGSASTTRTFTSVDSTAQRWSVSVEGLAGIEASVSVSRFTIKPGQSVDVAVTLARTDAPFGAYASGALVLRDGTRTVRLPITVQPIPVAAPARVTVSTTAASGSLPLSVRSGFTGPLSGVGWGLAAPQVDAGVRIEATTGKPDLSGSDPGTQLYPVTVPAGAQLLAARLTDATAGTDLDLYLYRDPNADGNYDDAQLVDMSAGPTADESIEEVLPEAGAYVFAVVAFDTAEGGSVYNMNRWLVNDPQPDDPSPAPGLVVSGDPVAAVVGQPATLTLEWSGVDAPGSYLGVVTYHDSAAPTLENLRGASIVEVVRSAGAAAPAVTVGGPVPTVTATGRISTRTVTAKAKAKPFTVRLGAIRVRTRTLTVAVKAPRGTALRVVVRRGARTVGSANARAAGAKVKVRLAHRPARGRYSVRVVAKRAGRTASAVRSVRVR